MKHRSQHDALPDVIVQSLANRDAALWIGPGFDTNAEQLGLLRQLIELPWRLVLCESTNATLAKSLETNTQATDRFNRRRGFVHLVASDPEGIELPPRALPVFFLNGRADASDREDSSQRPPRARQRRRLNMISRLGLAAPRVLFVLSSGGDYPLNDVFELWEEGFRSLLVVLSSDATDTARLDDWLKVASSAPAIDHCSAPFISSISTLVERASSTLTDDRYILRLRFGEEQQQELDVTDCDLIEQPLFDRYEPIQARDLPHIEPDDLSAEDLSSFFDRSAQSWRPFAAGLPWHRDHNVTSTLLKTLRRVEVAGCNENCVRIVACESGAGGTTLAKMLALDIARNGYPTLVARPLKFQPKATELEAFLYRVNQKASQLTQSSTRPHVAEEGSEAAAATPETPWLLVFDVQHWEGRLGEIPSLAKALARSGRPVVILAVTGPDISDELQHDPDTKVIERLRHELTEVDALTLGEHLNRFLKPFGKDKTSNQWRAFWEKHRPHDMEADVASFWITLEFWLKGQLDLSESVQQWIARHFKDAALTDDARQMLLEIAALSVERQPYPEALLPPSPDGEHPYSFVLTELRSDLPALALVCDGAPPSRQWAMAHDLIGRYLLKSVYFDRSQLTQLSLDAAADPVHLRLILLRRVAVRKELGRKLFTPLAMEFAVNILKLGTDGNLEYARYWKDVLEILEAMPRSIWETNRTFNHHVAISRRRIATNDELFHLSLNDKHEQLTKAIEHLEYALNRLQRTEADDETDLNLLNSLSLAYQNLADVERDRGSPEELLLELRQKATETARRAQQDNPTNSYVLETFARNLLQNGRLYPQQATLCAAEALGYIYQAMSLDRSLLRETRLTRLANEALSMLRSADAADQLAKICAAGNPLGFLGKAWLVLVEGEEQLTIDNLSRLSISKIEKALAVLDEAPNSATGLLTRFRYDLLTVSQPRNFEEQLNLLDELEGVANAMPVQLQLEHAILLHQMNRHPAANVEFRYIRDQLRNRDVYVDVPPRLRWFRAEDGKQRICHARVIETRDRRSHAKVTELDNAIVPFIPQEFGANRMPSGMSFRCAISFGAMGPFIKPPSDEDDKK